MSKLLEGLNEAQQKAVEYGNGQLLILAGAGSGKTKTLTHRIAYLIAERGVSPFSVLAVTFTNKAAGEMRERLELLLGGEARSVFLGTFHGFCVRLLRESGEEIGLDRNFTIFDSQDQLAAIKEAMARLRISDKSVKPRSVLHLISSAKNELINSSKYPEFAHSPLQNQTATIYPEYQRVLAAARAMDFDDLLMKSVELLRRSKTTLQKWNQKLEHILVDEYQDTNTAQYELIKLLAGDNGNLCVVGDDWQSIYSWRGADYRNILNFENDWPNTEVIKLEQNYRSTKHILDAAHKIITKNSNRSDKKLWTRGPEGSPVTIVPVSNEREEAETIIEKVKAAVSIKARKYSDFAVLYRTNAQSRSIEDMLVRYGVPYRIVGGTRFYERKEVKDIMAYLRYIHQPNDIVALKRLLNVPPRGLGDKSLTAILTMVQDESIDPMELFANPDKVNARLTTKAKSELIKLSQMFKKLREDSNNNRPISVITEDIIKAIGYIEYLEDGTIQSTERVENIGELISVTREYDSVGLAGFLEEVALVSDIDSWDNDADAITLMTLHAAKGLEFPAVFMVGMEEGIFPHSRAQFEADEMEEERRLCYVGMTRAKEELELIHASSRMLYGSVQHNPPSRFLSDIGGSARLVTHSTSSAETSREPIEVIDLKAGDKVKHPIFGDGLVEEVEHETATVSFRGGKSKKLNLAFAPLKKI